MSWIHLEAPERAAEPARTVFDEIRERSASGRVNHFWQACGLDPVGLEALHEHARALMGEPTPLTIAQAEMIAVVVSATNGCGYCVAHHGPKLAAACENEALARAVARDYRQADLAARDRVLLDYAVALTCEPAERTRDDVERLREYGFDDASILKATEITAYYNQANRLASGLGVTLEPGVEPWEFGAVE